MRHNKYLLIFSLLALVALSTVVLLQMKAWNERTEIVFLNVGQGDAILLIQGHHQVLIDAGRNGKDLLSHLGRYIPFWDRTIEVVIATHPDADHIGGFPALFRAYRVEKVLSTGAKNDTETSRLFEDGASKNERHEIFRGATLDFPNGGQLAIEYPFTPLHVAMEDTNAGSIVARFTYGETSVLFTGDLAHEETVLPQEKTVTLLKAAHHGSKYSTSQAFLDLIEPKEAIISVGKNNYGHPDQGVLERLEKMRAVIHRTDQEGDVRYRCVDQKKCIFVPQ